MPEVIILGDSFNNTLGLIRSVGETGVRPILILVGKDRLFISKSKYLKKIYNINEINESLPILKELSLNYKKAYLIASNDPAAEYIDENESYLATIFKTPMKGKTIGSLFKKEQQCKLAETCDITIPKSLIFYIKDTIPNLNYPVLIKPNNSLTGSKADIHICFSRDELEQCLKTQTLCLEFIIQEYIDKEYELNLIGIAKDGNILIPGAIKKLRHFPTDQSPCSYGVYLPINRVPIDINPIIDFVKKTNYSGPFSIEFLHYKNKNYFMEMNFRHDGLAYVPTAAGINLLDYYINNWESEKKNPKTIYMMDLSIDFCHVKRHTISLKRWIKDYFRTQCQLNFNIKDPLPTINYYISKMKNKIFKT